MNNLVGWGASASSRRKFSAPTGPNADLDRLVGVVGMCAPSISLVGYVMFIAWVDEFISRESLTLYLCHQVQATLMTKQKRKSCVRSDVLDRLSFICRTSINCSSTTRQHT